MLFPQIKRDKASLKERERGLKRFVTSHQGYESIYTLPGHSLACNETTYGVTLFWRASVRLLNVKSWSVTFTPVGLYINITPSFLLLITKAI